MTARKLACMLLLAAGCPAPLPVATEPPPVTTPVVRPPRPKLGRQLDRVGRPLITQTVVADHAAYDAASRPQWGTFTASIAQALSTFDAMDGMCGNQSLAATSTTGYAPLAALLADDRLFVNTDELSCGTYLAVELGLPGDCGGRVVGGDTVDAVYARLISGGADGVGDGIDVDDDVHSAVQFPFVAP